VGSWTKRRRSGSRIPFYSGRRWPNRHRGHVAQDSCSWWAKPGASPPHAAVYDAGAHVVLPGLINTHHHSYQTLTGRCRRRWTVNCFRAAGALSGMGAADPGVAPPRRHRRDVELLLSGCTTTTDHHYVFPAGSRTPSISKWPPPAPRLAGAVDAALDEPVAEGRPAAGPTGWCRRGHDFGRLRTRGAKHHQRGEDAMVQIAPGAVLARFR